MNIMDISVSPCLYGPCPFYAQIWSSLHIWNAHIWAYCVSLMWSMMSDIYDVSHLHIWKGYNFKLYNVSCPNEAS